MYGILGRKTTTYTVRYGEGIYGSGQPYMYTIHIRFWPTLNIHHTYTVLANPKYTPYYMVLAKSNYTPYYMVLAKSNYTSYMTTPHLSPYMTTPHLSPYTTAPHL